MLPARADPITQIGFPQLEHFAPLLYASNASLSAIIISSLFASGLFLYEVLRTLRC
jgi:hypothetical protein